MRILHTSDWHLGKNLEGHSRLKEQEMFLDELALMVEEEGVDLLIIAGDIYDTANPPALAEKLFYDTIGRIADFGERCVLVIAGNHDNPDRLEAASPLANTHGVILLGNPKSKVECGSYGNIEILESGEAYIKVRIRGEEAVIVTLPYPSEKRLNEVFSVGWDEEIRRKDYSERVGQLLAKASDNFRDDTINLAVSHLYMVGGDESGSERPIQLGGSFAIESSRLPNAQYIALGHLHRSQTVAGSLKRARYSGSPLQYSRSEIQNSNCVYIVDILPGQEAQIEQKFLKNYKPIEVWECQSIDDAMARCHLNAGRDIWAYLEIKTDREITQQQMKDMKSLVTDIVQIRPIFASADSDKDTEEADYEDLQMDELFKAYYKSVYGANIPEELLALFYKIVEGEEDEDETQITEDKGA
ncbi:MAG TPA: exonuclease SbcCD subunit D C-terminal domain-containing protein [Clostridia bacterium]|nr:exonuclease SbcCD subunit D C-terminal domain-containing protein [Clostridia bacterium]